MNKPLFSVVIPVYNRKDFITESIASVLNQNFRDWELLVVDDGSTDGTAEVVKSYSDPRIRYLYQDNAERGAARNLGIRNAQGEYIMFLDSDDRFLQDHMTKANLILKKNPGIKLFHLNFRFYKQGIKGKVNELPAILNREFVKGNMIGCAGVVVHRNVAVKFLFNEDRRLAGTEDYELWLRMCAAITFHHFPYVTSLFYDHEERSMALQELESLENRIIFFLDTVSANKDVKTFLNNDFNRFVAYRYSYIALHAAMAGNRKKAIEYLRLMWKSAPALYFSRRMIHILRFIIAG